MQIQLETSVVFQITRHLHDQFPRSAGGILLGSEEEDTLQVTECFPLPVDAFEGEGQNLRSKETTNYKNTMIEKLKVVSSDSQVQGWYIGSTIAGLYQQSILDFMYALQIENPAAVTLVHDVAFSKSCNSLSLRAFKLSPEFMAARTEKISTENLEKHGLNHANILVESSIYIHNSHLVNLLSISSFVPKLSAGAQLSIPQQNLVEGTVASISDGVDDFIVDQSNYNYYHRQLTREKQKVAQWQQKRKAENAQRVAEGKQPLSLDEWKLSFKMPEEPSRLENLLVGAQIEDYCGQIDELGAVSRITMA